MSEGVKKEASQGLSDGNQIGAQDVKVESESPKPWDPHVGGGVY